jgi:hypothetical protein
LPLHYRRLGKSRPKPKAYDEAIQMGLAILACFAHCADTHRAIIRINANAGEAISFQPRPWGANWTAAHALSPDALLDPGLDPLTMHGQLPQVSTADILHLSRLTALAFIDHVGQEPPGEIRASATFEFVTLDDNRPTARLLYRPFEQHHLPARIEMLRYA